KVSVVVRLSRSAEAARSSSWTSGSDGNWGRCGCARTACAKASHAPAPASHHAKGRSQMRRATRGKSDTHSTSQFSDGDAVSYRSVQGCAKGQSAETAETAEKTWLCVLCGWPYWPGVGATSIVPGGRFFLKMAAPRRPPIVENTAPIAS